MIALFLRLIYNPLVLIGIAGLWYWGLEYEPDWMVPIFLGTIIYASVAVRAHRYLKAWRFRREAKARQMAPKLAAPKRQKPAKPQPLPVVSQRVEPVRASGRASPDAMQATLPEGLNTLVERGRTGEPPASPAAAARVAVPSEPPGAPAAAKGSAPPRPARPPRPPRAVHHARP